MPWCGAGTGGSEETVEAGEAETWDKEERRKKAPPPLGDDASQLNWKPSQGAKRRRHPWVTTQVSECDEYVGAPVVPRLARSLLGLFSRCRVI
jgi:hypothetical protein